ncbi:PEP-CTERM sorting domain-containing protein [Roseateles sp. NT4]|uniref:DUF4114 domain-containing protein n=1 Tax=Roseateles sp. NT4 TaxID=3453715 RepID=UPI003EEC9ABB
MKTATRRLLLGASASLLSLAAYANPAVYPTPGTEAPASSFTAGASGTLLAYYTGEAGGFTNLVGARINGVDGTPGLDNHASAYGQTFVLGKVTAGDSLVFFIDANSGAARYYSDVSLNSDHVNHVWAAAFTGDAQVPAGTNLAFEDLPSGGDFNYRDHSIVFQIQAVPEPASWAMLLAGAAGLAWRRRGR